ncbi:MULTISPECIES: OmpW family protein [Microbulbifer]|uniref:OmpW/AlkL family protein n=1 Tax=Microbulbifer TaxID=48073 RepID=UPI001E4BD876|nr:MULTISPECIES: OmpW family outer membrane protein [Microbulbifer]UHQ54166.1 outer membrane beta-barrel protein [Microbulbifer sp. YPW16]
MKTKDVFIPAVAALTLAVSSVASAGPSGYTPAPPPPPAQEFVVRLGATYIDPIQDDVTFTDDTFQFFDSFRATVDPDAEWGWYINGEWRPMHHWGIELTYAQGDDHVGGDADGYFSIISDINDFGFDDLGLRDIGEFEPEIGTASLKWYPLDPSCLVQPYIGGGISYTDFGSENFRGPARADLDAANLRGRVNLGYSWGYTWQAGVDFNFGHDSAWLVNASAMYVRAVTDMQFQVFSREPLAEDEEFFFESYSGDYIYDPWMFNLSVGYKFAF